MATAKKRSRRRLSPPALAVVGLALCAGVVAFAYRESIGGYSTIGAAYGARIGCTCRYVSGLPLRECRAAIDVEDGPGMLFLSEDEDNQSVTARVPMLAGQTAYYREGWGCVLEPWDD
ncbi:MAG: hypothetical protein WCY92_07745 [Novosphingobium sp.]